MKTGCERRLDKSFRNAPVLALGPRSRIVLFSDCHRGVGNANDNFLKNQNLYFAALRHYYKRGFVYVELGDGDELWENRSLAAIREIHGDVFCLLSLFHREGRLYQLYGNHDHALKGSREQPHYSGLVLKVCGNAAARKAAGGAAIGNAAAKKSAGDAPVGNLRPSQPCREIYVTHGHQADLLNSTFWKLSRFLVRYLWKPLEQLGVLDPTSSAKNYRRRQKSEKKLSAWAIKNNCYLITGHTHRPMLGDPGTHYSNTGSCVHPYCITCIEIEDNAATLVKWHVETRQDRSLFVSRSVLAGPLPLDQLT